MYITSMKRMEKKYLLSTEQFQKLMPTILQYMKLDQYGLQTICNVYYDTPDYRLIQESITKPVFKEKFRLRSYGRATADTEIFVEMKRKFKREVYKRRAVLPLHTAEQFMKTNLMTINPSQELREIRYMNRLYRLEPKAYIAYEREAYYGLECKDLRITFDRNLRGRYSQLTLSAPSHGTPIQPKDTILMEIKVPYAAPLWMAEAFSKLKIYPTSFSKYGTYYTNTLAQPSKGEIYDVA